MNFWRKQKNSKLDCSECKRGRRSIELRLCVLKKIHFIVIAQFLYLGIC